MHFRHLARENSVRGHFEVTWLEKTRIGVTSRSLDSRKLGSKSLRGRGNSRKLGSLSQSTKPINSHFLSFPAHLCPFHAWIVCQLQCSTLKPSNLHAHFQSISSQATSPSMFIFESCVNSMYVSLLLGWPLFVNACACLFQPYNLFQYIICFLSLSSSCYPSLINGHVPSALDLTHLRHFAVSLWAFTCPSDAWAVFVYAWF